MSQPEVELLRALRAAVPGGVSVDSLAMRCGLTSERLAQSIGEFCAAGYGIELQNGQYVFQSAPDRLIADDVRAGLGGDVTIGREIVVLETTNSTNEFLRRIATPQMPEGLVIFAEEQTAGRGQHGKHWASATRLGLWFSILLRPQLQVAQSARLTNWIARSIAETVTLELSITAAVKPPNDVYIDDRKVSGVLVEMLAAERSHFAIAGIGINVNHAPADFPEDLRGRAGSLSMAAGRKLDRRDFAVAVLRGLERSYSETFAP